jgi:hypothetical protein
MTYGSEIWISEFKINFNVIDKLLLEKIKNMIFSTFSPVEIQFEPKKGVYYYINSYLQ